jgi:hypothetical protein
MIIIIRRSFYIKIVFSMVFLSIIMRVVEYHV